MNILTLTLMLLGIVFIVMGYMNMFYNLKTNEINNEYRTVPDTSTLTQDNMGLDYVDTSASYYDSIEINVDTNNGMIPAPFNT